MMKQYILCDRVNSRRGPYGDLNDPNRGVREAIHGTDEDRRLYGVDGCMSLIFPGTVREVRPNGHLEIEYDIGGRAVEIPENVRPRQVMPWHPKNVPLHMMLRRNIGHGRVLEGLQVRWAYVARLLQALCAFHDKDMDHGGLAALKRSPCINITIQLYLKCVMCSQRNQISVHVLLLELLMVSLSERRM